jgi:hypothetical protein
MRYRHPWRAFSGIGQEGAAGLRVIIKVVVALLAAYAGVCVTSVHQNAYRRFGPVVSRCA